ncbi:MAG: hypothetical protein H0W72_09470 [Planctomycetes bacterium]|nr:hypothetical protein [Planctomycetota bacterium]
MRFPLLLVLLASLGGWAVATEVLPAGANPMCPVMTDEPADPAYVVEHEGRKVYLCCKKCVRKWKEDPAKYLPNLPASDAQQPAKPAQAAPSQAEPHSALPAPMRPVATAPPPPAQPIATSDQPSLSARLLRFLGAFHPAVVHFPIALLAAAALFEALQWRRDGTLSPAARPVVLLAALGGAMATALGWAAWSGAGYPDAQVTLALHQWIGTAAGTGAVLSAWTGERARRHACAARARVYRAVLFLGTAAVLGAGFLGGLLIYGPEHYRF